MILNKENIKNLWAYGTKVLQIQSQNYYYEDNTKKHYTRKKKEEKERQTAPQQSGFQKSMDAITERQKRIEEQRRRLFNEFGDK